MPNLSMSTPNQAFDQWINQQDYDHMPNHVLDTVRRAFLDGFAAHKALDSSETMLIDYLAAHWESQHVGAQRLLDGRKISNPTGSFRDALTAEMTKRPIAGLAVNKISTLSQWQDMDSAPKDGTHVLIETKRDGLCILSWQDDAWDVGYEGYSYSEREVKRWMPLPPV